MQLETAKRGEVAHRTVAPAQQADVDPVPNSKERSRVRIIPFTPQDGTSLQAGLPSTSGSGHTVLSVKGRHQEKRLVRQGIAVPRLARHQREPGRLRNEGSTLQWKGTRSRRPTWLNPEFSTTRPLGLSTNSHSVPESASSSERAPRRAATAERMVSVRDLRLMQVASEAKGGRPRDSGSRRDRGFRGEGGLGHW